MNDRDGSFRRLIEMVKEQQATPLTGKPGRPPKHRVSTTGYFAVNIHTRMKLLAKERSKEVESAVSTADVYNDAAIMLITDLHALLGEELKLPAGAVSVSGILGLRELLDRPVKIPLKNLELQSGELQRTTIYIDQPVWDALVEMSLRFGLSMRHTIYVQRLLELAAAWYLAGLES
ncbi:MAG: hypothetical protein K8S97_02705 [Anaerolineae bacterium]|nr:hypothetical protein [Anaerolineae bacterium]